MNQCVFCKIVNHEADAVTVYEDEETVAFMDKEPFNLGHTLVTPKKHYKFITDMPENEVCSLFKVVSRVAKAVLKATRSDGLNLGQSNGEAASQQIFHVHVHIIPRFKGDAEDSMFPPRKQPSLEELKESGRRIQDALGLTKSEL